jgi:hypothetical protein
MKSQTALALWILMAGAALAQAQTTGIWMGVGPAPRSGVIQDAPFSADLVSINDRTDSQPGLQTDFHGKVARNSQGSSYYAMEHLLPVAEAPRPVRITITDPAAQSITILDPQQKTASVSRMTVTAAGAAALLTPGNAASTLRPASAAAPSAPSVTSGNTATEELGSKTIGGLQLIGVRTTHTTQNSNPDGKPFVSTTETWSSPELKIIVLSETRTSNGDRHVTRLENIVRSEPSASLFEVPAGYSVRNNMPAVSNVH